MPLVSSTLPALAVSAPKLGIAAAMGIAVILLVWGMRGFLLRRYQRDRDWIATSYLRFHPDPIDADKWTFMYYGIFCLLLVMLIGFSPNPIVAVLLWLVLLMVPKMVIESMWQKRRRKIDLQLPAAIATLANSLRAGLTLVQAIDRLADTAPEPIRSDFRIMANRYRYGASLEATVREAKQRIDSQNFNLFASALLLNREMGGDVADTLSRISQSLDKLHQMRQTVEAHTSEGRTNIKVLMVAPILLLLMMSTADPEGITLLFTTSQGYAVLLVAGLLIATGVFFANRITKQEI